MHSTRNKNRNMTYSTRMKTMWGLVATAASTNVEYVNKTSPVFFIVQKASLLPPIADCGMTAF